MLHDLERKKKMARFKAQPVVMKYFYYRMAIIQVQVGESNDEAWRRHIIETPDDIHATIRVFNSKFPEETYCRNESFDMAGELARNNLPAGNRPGECK